MTKEESLELAKKCGAVVDNFVSDDKSDYTVEFRRDEFAAYTSAIEEKHQAQNVELQKQIAMLRDALTRLKSDAWLVPVQQLMYRGSPFVRMANDAIHATKATADAFIAEVKARERQSVLNELQEFFSDAIQADFENGVKSLNEREAAEFKRRFPNIWEGIGKIGEMLDAIELRNQQPKQPRKPCTCEGWCDGLCLEKEGKRK